MSKLTFPFYGEIKILKVLSRFNHPTVFVCEDLNSSKLFFEQVYDYDDDSIMTWISFAISDAEYISLLKNELDYRTLYLSKKNFIHFEETSSNFTYNHKTLDELPKRYIPLKNTFFGSEEFYEDQLYSRVRESNHPTLEFIFNTRMSGHIRLSLLNAILSEIAHILPPDLTETSIGTSSTIIRLEVTERSSIFEDYSTERFPQLDTNQTIDDLNFILDNPEETEIIERFKDKPKVFDSLKKFTLSLSKKIQDEDVKILIAKSPANIKTHKYNAESLNDLSSKINSVNFISAQRGDDSSIVEVYAYNKRKKSIEFMYKNVEITGVLSNSQILELGSKMEIPGFYYVTFSCVFETKTTKNKTTTKATKVTISGISKPDVKNHSPLD